MTLYTIEFTVNNYVLGAKVKSTPTHKIVKQERIDSKHTVIQYADVTLSELKFIEKVLAYQHTVVSVKRVNK